MTDYWQPRKCKSIESYIMYISRVLGAVGATCLHLNVCSMNLSLSFASEYFSRSSTFWIDVRRNLEPVWGSCSRYSRFNIKESNIENSLLTWHYQAQNNEDLYKIKLLIVYYPQKAWVSLWVAFLDPPFFS